MVIQRDDYLNQLISKQGNGLIKVITGIRRCGKSYLLFHLFVSYLKKQGVKDDHILQMSFDTYENEIYQDPAVFYPYIRGKIKDDQRYYILLD